MKFRDPETGEFKELYAKAADTLPVGSVVDFEGNEVPAGWEKFEEVEDFTNKVEYPVQGDTYSFKRQGKVVVINYRGANIQHSSEEALFRIPEGYRPAQGSIWGFMQDADGNNVYFYMQNGVFKPSCENQTRLLINLTYISE